jgi:hypothetical protein
LEAWLFGWPRAASGIATFDDLAQVGRMIKRVSNPLLAGAVLWYACRVATFGRER